MATGQKLRGLIGSGMDGQRPAISPEQFIYAPAANSSASYSFTAPRGGCYRFVAWGPGGGDAAGQGGGGALVVAERLLGAQEAVSIVVGGSSSAGASGATSLSFASGEMLIAGAGANGPTGPGGTALINNQRGDIGVAGSPGMLFSGGAAASYGPYIGGQGSGGNTPGGGSPGGGTGGNSGGPSKGGGGLVVVCRVKMRP
jgi:hypothetical protein